MTMAQKAKTPCAFFAFNSCQAKSCPFLHDASNKYKGPPPKALRFAKGKPPPKAHAAVAQVHAMPAFEDSKVSWLWDTAAGRHLFGRQALTQKMRECASPSNSPVNFTTGGGAQQSADSLAFTGSKILEGEEVYILKECPPAQSIGKTVMDEGYMFIWDPREQAPYLIPPSIVPKCRLRIPRKHRIYVPQYDEQVQPAQFVPPERLQPLGAVDATPAETSADLISDEEYTPSVAADNVSEPVEFVEDASPRSSARGSETAEAFAGGIPPHPDDD